MIELQLELSDEVAAEILQEVKNLKDQFSLMPALTGQELKLDRVTEDGIVIGQETSKVLSVELVDYSIFGDA